jgi:hypothetical protein
MPGYAAASAPERGKDAEARRRINQAAAGCPKIIAKQLVTRRPDGRWGGRAACPIVESIHFAGTVDSRIKRW